MTSPIAGGMFWRAVSFSHLHRLFVWAVGRGIIEVNPLQHAERSGAEVSRDRVLSDEELSKVWLAAEQLAGAYPPYRDALRLLILTGARKMEITALRWEEIRDGAIHLEGERTKNGRPHIIPLSAAARAILDGIEQNSGFVFPVGAAPTSQLGSGEREARRVLRCHRLDDPRSAPHRGNWPATPWRATAGHRERAGPQGGSRSGIVASTKDTIMRGETRSA